MIRLREEMQTEKPTMLNCSKDAHIIFEVFSFNIWVRHCEELIREDWKKLMGNYQLRTFSSSAESYSENDWGLHSENE
jgi:hypothetical protein